MSGTSNQRLKVYVSMASIPTLAAAGGMAVSEIASADIVYEEVSLSINDGSATLDMGFAAFRFSGFNADSGEFTGGGFGVKGSEQLQIIGSQGKGSSGIPKVRRFNDGQQIDAGPTSWLSDALGAASINFQTKKGGSANLGFGNWLNKTDEPVSGYMGFAFVGSSAGDDLPPATYGWISLAWDGATLTIDGYAYESEAGVGIRAGTVPAPGAIGLLGLAAGAAGLRRKRQA